jgi:hypothetical protein
VKDRQQEVAEIKKYFIANGNKDNFATGSGHMELLKPLASRRNVVLIDGVPMMADMAEQYLEVKRKKAIERMRPANSTEIRLTLKAVKKLLLGAPSFTKPKKIIIASTWRSGSTFLGQVLASYPGVFYHYEPLSHVGVKRVRDREDPSVELIDQLFKCDFNHKKYMNYTRQYPEDMLGHNYHVWSACKSSTNRNVCLNETFLHDACRLFPIQVTKLFIWTQSICEPPWTMDRKMKRFL